MKKELPRNIHFQTQKSITKSSSLMVIPTQHNRRVLSLRKLDRHDLTDTSAIMLDSMSPIFFTDTTTGKTKSRSKLSRGSPLYDKSNGSICCSFNMYTA